jgi:hypothetical protein
LIKFIKDILFGAFLVGLLTVVIICITFATPIAYKSYLRSYVVDRVVQINPKKPETAAQMQNPGGGTGFHVLAPSGKTYIMTNRHVCNLAIEGKMWVKNKTQSKSLKVITSSDSFDLCLIEPLPGIDGIKVGDTPVEGQAVSYAGYPRLQPRTFESGEIAGTKMLTIAAGVVGKDITEEQCQTKDSSIAQVPEILTLLSKAQVDQDLSPWADHPLFKNGKMVDMCYQRNTALVTTLIIYGGASGSPMVDILGRLIGVVYAAPTTGGWGYGVTIDNVKTILTGR